MNRYLSLAVVASLLLCTAPAFAQGTKLVTESYHVPARDPGIQLYVRNKRPEGLTRFTSDNVLLFVHGATYPAESSFDLALDGVSWMDWIAQRGWDVYLLDVRGYGASTRPAEMDRPAKDSGPIVNGETAIRDVGAVVDHILARRGLRKINLLGWSWGTVLMAGYTAQNADKVERLVLYAPVWIRTTPSLVAVDGPLPAYRTVTKEAAEKRKRVGVPPGKDKELMSSEWFDAWWNASQATDPVGAAQTPPVIRAPNGVVEDGRKYWSAGVPYYDAARLTVPTLLAVAEWDADTPPYMAQTLFGKLTNAPRKRLVMIGEGTHSVMMEKNRMQLFAEVQLFLDERR